MVALGLSVFSLSTLYAIKSYTNKNNVSAESADLKTNQSPEWNYKWDHRTINSPNNSIRKFTLIRHGQYVHDADPLKKVLTDLGKEQARITGQKLKSMGIKYDQIICSEMVRAKQTANIITNELFSDKNGDKISIKYDGNLNEGCPSNVIPIRKDLNKSGFFKHLDEDSSRISEAFETYIHRNDTENDEEILIIGHGNVFRYFMCRVLQIPNEAWLRFSICNCGITKFKVFGDGRISVECIGSDGHFERSKLRTFN